MAWNVIPQIFYDFIGRLVPGALLLFVALFMFEHGAARAIVQQAGLSDAEQFLLFLTCAYLLGLALDHVWNLVFANLFAAQLMRMEVVQQRRSVARHYRLEADRVNAVMAGMPSVRTIHDVLLVRHPEDAQRLSKVRADSVLCRTLAVGLGALAVLALWYNRTHAVALAVLALVFLNAWWQTLAVLARLATSTWLTRGAQEEFARMRSGWVSRT